MKIGIVPGFWLVGLLGLLLSGCGGGGETQSLPLGTFTIHSNGGDGGLQGGFGGNGGGVSAVKEGGTGALTVVRSGEVDASYVSVSLAPELGPNPLEITTDTVVAVVTSVPSAGTPYLLAGNDSLFVSDGVNLQGNLVKVTGLRVSPGVTLTLGLNQSTWARLSLANDVENQGIITTEEVDALQRGHLQLSVGSYFGSGNIDVGGITLGQNGGAVFLYAPGDIVHQGRINTAGAAAASGLAGAGGDVELYAGGELEISGPIDTAGGEASVGTGGNGGYIDLVGDFGLYKAARLSTTGGAGTVGGGHGGWVWLEVYTEGELRSAGDIDSSGGSSSNGAGGNGGDMDIYAYGGSVRHNGHLLADGGRSQGGHGGRGGYLVFGTFQGWNVTTAPGDIRVSGNLDTSGGDGGASGNGGNGGTIDFYLGNFAAENPALEENQGLALLGYQNLETSGGAGNFGGSGGEVQLLADYGYANPGRLSNEANIVTRGGNAVAGSAILPAPGGKAGDVYLETYADPQNAANPLGTRLSNAGSIDASGGAGVETDGSTWWAGSAGYVMLYGAEGLTNSAQISARGGDDRGLDGGATGVGGNGNWIVLMADGPLVNSGRLDSTGGSGEYRGAAAGDVFLGGRHEVSNSGAIYARGGEARADLFGSLGGDGGWVEIGLLEGTGPVTNSAAVFLNGGGGATPGVNGNLTVGQ